MHMHIERYMDGKVPNISATPNSKCLSKLGSVFNGYQTLRTVDVHSKVSDRWKCEELPNLIIFDNFSGNNLFWRSKHKTDSVVLRYQHRFLLKYLMCLSVCVYKCACVTLCYIVTVYTLFALHSIKYLSLLVSNLNEKLRQSLSKKKHTLKQLTSKVIYI